MTPIILAAAFLVGAMAVAGGGNFLQGFAASAIGAAAGLVSDVVSAGNLIVDTIIVAAAGCAGAIVTGGKCANGAITAAFGNIFNKYGSLLTAMMDAPPGFELSKYRSDALNMRCEFYRRAIIYGVGPARVWLLRQFALRFPVTLAGRSWTGVTKPDGGWSLDNVGWDFKGIQPAKRYENFGNFMYGYLGKMAGLSNVELYGGAGVFQSGHLNRPAEFNFQELGGMMWRSYGDDHSDHSYVRDGIGAYGRGSQYPWS